ncbi:hypothetical protein [Pseudanabaena sp. ABRG5-3]|uniref:hypothetical protein n=1 Tax=Pseudanabaena sp. ABRG5-3 TaxID=685565 RepID=UPI000DC71568|nr:hypothetical protein [Pseudanabaena sp. ABRG5-3]BBC23213.1 hypothetical protein ABRG53_0956 [Pseudanabaena sp. ABRG5-3]
MPATLQASRLSLYDGESKLQLQSLVLGQIKTQELIGGAERRQSILGFTLGDSYIKLEPTPSPTYTLSKVFSLSEPENHLYLLLQILKSLGQLVISI